MPQSQPPAQSSRIPLPGSGQVPLLLAMLVFLVTLIVTFSAWSSARRSAESQLLETFDYRTRDMVFSISRRMAVYEQVLRGARGFLRGSVELERRDWERYYRLLRLDQSFPGMEALGIATIVPPGELAAHEAAMRRGGHPDYALHPPGPREFHTAITHIEPFGGRNLRAFGYDMFSEPVRRSAMERARDTGQAALSGKVVLVQEGIAHEGPGGQQAGALMYLPVYRAGELTGTVEQRRKAIVGWVYAPFRMNDLMKGLGGAHSTDLEVEIHDGEPADGATLLYRSPNAGNGARASHDGPRLRASAQIVPGGRTWTITMRSSAALENSLDTARPWLVAFTGVGLSFLLSLVVWLLASERRRALQLAQGMTLELRQSHERIQVILENAPDAFVALDARGRITDWNAQASRLFGWSAAQALGRDAQELLPEERRAAFRAAYAAFARDGSCPMLGAPTELTVLDREGRRIPAEVTVAPLTLGEGFGATAFVRDIRQRKEAEARELQRQQRLDEARQALARGQKLEAVGKLTGGVAHDFNNILHIISANVQLILRADSSQRKRLLSILDAVERGSKLAGQLLAFARRQPLHPLAVHVDQLLERMDSLVQRAAGDQITLERRVPPGLWPTLADPNQLENVLLNLVINARDAMEGNGRIVLALENVQIDEDAVLAPGDYVTVAVADSGHGMPQEVMERAFEPFFTTKPEGKGTGLGLSMAHGFARQSGGDIRLASEPGKGTTVTIYLPRHVATVPVATLDGAATPH